MFIDETKRKEHSESVKKATEKIVHFADVCRMEKMKHENQDDNGTI